MPTFLQMRPMHRDLFMNKATPYIYTTISLTFSPRLPHLFHSFVTAIELSWFLIPRSGGIPQRMFFPVGEKSISCQDSQNKVFNGDTRELLTWRIASSCLPFVAAVMTYSGVLEIPSARSWSAPVSATGMVRLGRQYCIAGYALSRVIHHIQSGILFWNG